MTYAGLLLIVLTQLHRYVVRRDQMIELRIVTSETDLLADNTLRSDDRGYRGRGTFHQESSQIPIRYYELAPLLDPDDTPVSRRRHAMIVVSDKGPVAFLVERVEEMYQEHIAAMQHLSPLFTNQLAHAWFLGVVILDDTPLLVLDLNQMAQDIITTTSGHPPCVNRSLDLYAPAATQPT